MTKYEYATEKNILNVAVFAELALDSIVEYCKAVPKIVGLRPGFAEAVDLSGANDITIRLSHVWRLGHRRVTVT